MEQRKGPPQPARVCRMSVGAPTLARPRPRSHSLSLTLALSPAAHRMGSAAQNERNPAEATSALELISTICPRHHHDLAWTGMARGEAATGRRTEPQRRTEDGVGLLCLCDETRRQTSGSRAVPSVGLAWRPRPCAALPCTHASTRPACGDDERRLHAEGDSGRLCHLYSRHNGLVPGASQDAATARLTERQESVCRWRSRSRSLSICQLQGRFARGGGKAVFCGGPHYECPARNLWRDGASTLPQHSSPQKRAGPKWVGPECRALLTCQRCPRPLQTQPRSAAWRGHAGYAYLFSLFPVRQGLGPRRHARHARAPTPLPAAQHSTAKHRLAMAAALVAPRIARDGGKCPLFFRFCPKRAVTARRPSLLHWLA